MEKKTFQVPNIGCDGCVNSIKNELGKLSGIQSVDGVVDTKTVTVEWTDPANWTKIVEVLKDIDYAPAGA
ncbi:MAG TPA: heavy-metal-associated domain-containing protein [Phototrophicaceae bacterium]|jgi:copper chaperone CopZ|nr:heavy-metal-associated domain-containing protein [Phototrophicaceae bacterium]